MGKTFSGSTEHVGNAPLMTPEQQGYLSQTLSGLGPQAHQAYGQFLQPQSQEQMQQLFQQSFIDPAMLSYEQNVLPAIQQRFVDAGAGSSSALNQALGASARDISTLLGGQMGQFSQGQQTNQLQALQLLNQLIGQKTQEPIIEQREGLLGPLIGAAGTLGAAALSSRQVKENVEDFSKGLDLINGMDVKKYDYKPGFGNKGKLGLIAEDMPKEVQCDINGILGVDLYGLLAISINAIKQLSIKVEKLEAQHGNCNT